MDIAKHPRTRLDSRILRAVELLHDSSLKRGSVASYLAALVLMAAAVLLRLAVAPLEAGLQYLTLFPAIALAAVLGGFGPGMFATLVGICCATFIFVPPYFTISYEAWRVSLWANAVFLMDGFITCAIVHAMQRYQDGLSSALSKLRRNDQAMQTTTDGFWIIDATGKFLEVNDNYCRMTGYAREELLAMRIADLEANESAQGVAEHTRSIIEQGHEVLETRHRCKDGSIIDVEISTSFVPGNGNVFVTFARNISGRKQIEADLRDSEERFRLLFENAPVGIALALSNRKLDLANPAFCKMFGYTPEELRGLSVEDLTHPEHREQTRQLAAGIIGGNISAYARDKKYLRKDGSYFWGHITAAAIRNSSRQIVFGMGIVEDITWRIESEASRIEEIKAQKNMLVREIHHRIKNNLQGIVGLLQLHASTHPELSGLVAVLVNRMHAIAVIHGLQANAANTANAVMEEVDLARLVESIVGACGCAVKYSNELPRPVLLDKDDAVPVALALSELLTNACKHCTTTESIMVGIRGDHPEAVISIANRFDIGKAATAGHGLELVRALLPRQSSALRIAQADDIYMVDVKLTTPTLIFDLCANYENGGRPCPYLLSCWSKTTG